MLGEAGISVAELPVIHDLARPIEWLLLLSDLHVRLQAILMPHIRKKDRGVN